MSQVRCSSKRTGIFTLCAKTRIQGVREEIVSVQGQHHLRMVRKSSASFPHWRSRGNHLIAFGESPAPGWWQARQATGSQGPRTE